ncbi:MAG: hypothetical protein JWO37_1007 [Acidimicrobiales bacterium]|jgi:hypothetical protein|nr:hypothetical protein [Acidimicrobiales bacterium]
MSRSPFSSDRRGRTALMLVAALVVRSTEESCPPTQNYP